MRPITRGRSPVFTLAVFAALTAIAAVGIGPAAAARADTAAEPDQMPAVLYSAAPSEGEAWVSLAHALRHGASIDLSMFSGSARLTVESELRTVRRVAKPCGEEPEIARWVDIPTSVASADCPAVRVLALSPPEDVGVFVRGARAVVVGRVEGVAPGFALGADATLMKIRVQRALAGVDGSEPGDTVFVSMPYARFAVGDLVFCSGSELPGDYRVAEGDGVLVLLRRSPIDEHGRLYVVAMYEVAFFDAARGRLVLPAAFGGGLGIPPEVIAVAERRTGPARGADAESALGELAGWLEQRARDAGVEPVSH